MTDAGPIVIAVCCREWPVAAFMHISKCGYCGERPRVKI